MLRLRLRAIDDEFERLVMEHSSSKVTLKRDRAPEKLVEEINKLEDKIKTFKLQMVDREVGKEVALGTSKINYLDPRWVNPSPNFSFLIFFLFSWGSVMYGIILLGKKHDVPIEKMFSKTLLIKCASFPPSVISSHPSSPIVTLTKSVQSLRSPLPKMVILLSNPRKRNT